MFRQDLDQLTIFQGMSRDQIKALDPIMELCEFPANCLIFEQGQLADYLYILIEGEVQINYKPYDGPPSLEVSRIARGGIFGWSAAMRHEVYTSSAITLEKSQAYRITSERLHQLCSKSPETGIILMKRIATAIAKRLDSTHGQILAILMEGVDLEGDCLRKFNDDDEQ